MATVEDQLLTIIANQQTIINNQAAALTAIQNIPGANTAAITDALTQIEGQVEEIDALLHPTPPSAPPTA